MKSIEERAKAASEDYNDDGYSAGLYMGYKVGATEQKIIDINKACSCAFDICLRAFSWTIAAIIMPTNKES